VADRVIDLAPLGISTSVGTCAFVPQGRPGAGRFKLANYAASEWFDVTVAPDGNGTYSIAAVGGDAYFYFQAGYLDPGSATGFAATSGLEVWVR